MDVILDLVYQVLENKSLSEIQVSQIAGGGGANG